MAGESHLHQPHEAPSRPLALPSPRAGQAVFNLLQYYTVERRFCLIGDEHDAHVRLPAVRSSKTECSSEGNHRAQHTPTVECSLYSGNDSIMHTAMRWPRPRSTGGCWFESQLRGKRERERASERLKVPLKEHQDPSGSSTEEACSYTQPLPAVDASDWRLTNRNRLRQNSRSSFSLRPGLQHTSHTSRRPCHSRSAGSGSRRVA